MNVFGMGCNNCATNLDPAMLRLRFRIVVSDSSTSPGLSTESGSIPASSRRLQPSTVLSGDLRLRVELNGVLGKSYVRQIAAGGG